MMWASFYGHTEIVSLLLQYGAQVNVQDIEGWSSLMLASQNGHSETVLLLIQNGALQENEGFSSLMFASKNGHSETVLVLLRNSAHINLQEIQQGWSPLMFASRNGHSETVSLLLQNGADVNMQNNKGWSSLMIASQNGHTVTVLVLLQNGAHANMRDNEGQSSLWMASKNGHTEIVSLLLQNGAHVNMQDKKGWSALMISCHYEHYITCSLLHEWGADLNLQTTGRGLTALMVAIIGGSIKMVLFLTNCGADTSIKTVRGSSALIFASQTNQILVVERILNHKTFRDASLVDSQDDYGNNPLMVATLYGHTEIVKLFLVAGAQVNISNFSDYQSLHLPPHQIQLSMDDRCTTVRGSALDIAVISGYVEIVPHLLQYSAKIHNIYYLFRSIILKQSQMNTAERANSLGQMVGVPTKVKNSSCCDWEKYSTILHLLFSHDSDLIRRVQCTKPSILYVACAFGVIEVVLLLMKLGTGAGDLYRRDDSGSIYWCSFITIISSGSLLSVAASKHTSRDIMDLLRHVNWVKYLRIISILIENGLDVNHQDSLGSFALGIASREGHTDLIRFLLQCRADVNLQDREGISSLIEATSSGHLEICRLLLLHHAEVDLLDSKGWSALMVAVAADNVDLVLLLLESGAQINLQDASGTSSLMLSCLAGYTRMTKVLLGHGAEVNLQNTDGITALMMSSYNGRTEIVELLMRDGADISIVTSIGMTALRVSTENGHKDITKLLIECGASNHSENPRKRTLLTRESTITSSVPHYVMDNTQRLDRIEDILKTLLQIQGAYPTDKFINVELKPTLSECLKLLVPVAYDWKLIGTLLELEHSSLETIKRDNMGISKDCLQDVLHKWLVRVSPPTWEELAEAVEHTDQTIARKIRRIN